MKRLSPILVRSGGVLFLLLSCGGGAMGTEDAVATNGTAATTDDIEVARPTCMEYCHRSLVMSNDEPTCPGNELGEEECLAECLSGSFECLMAKRRQHICDMGSSSVKCATNESGDPTFTWESEQCSMYAQLTDFACAATTTGDMMSPVQVQEFADTCDEYCTRSDDPQCLSNQASMCRKQCMTGEVSCLKAKLTQYTCELANAEPMCVVSDLDDLEYPQWTDADCTNEVHNMEDVCPFDVRLPKRE